MASELDFQLAGHENAIQDRNGYINNFDNATRQSVTIDIEMTAIPVLLGICFLVGMLMFLPPSYLFYF